MSSKKSSSAITPDNKTTKKFLSPTGDEYSTVSTEIGPRSWGKGVNVTLRLTDCDRPIFLDLSFTSNKQLKERLDKLNTLITELQNLKKDMKSYKYNIPKENKDD